MSLSNSPEHQAAIDRFWANYLFILKKNNVPAKSIPWYHKHVEAYIKANECTPLSLHTGMDIDRYLNAKSRPSITDEGC